MLDNFIYFINNLNKKCFYFFIVRYVNLLILNINLTKHYMINKEFFYIIIKKNFKINKVLNIKI